MLVYSKKHCYFEMKYIIFYEKINMCKKYHM